MDSFTFLEKTSTWIKNSILLKITGIGILLLLFLIPTEMIQRLVYDRNTLQNEAIASINRDWGDCQTISGPVLTIPYITVVKKDNNKLVKEKKFAHFLPEKLSITSEVQPTIRKRGIYKATLYEASLNFSGGFDLPELSPEQIDAEQILYEESFFEIGIPDMRGITRAVAFIWNGTNLSAEPGLPDDEIASSGMHVPVNLKDLQSQTTIPFLFSLKINGSDNISFVPLGKETSVKISSPWHSPAFNGAFLPQKHTITDNGFTAEWNVLHFNRNYPQSWLGSGYNLTSSAFGVRMITPVQHYQMITRSVKYATLIIFLTFILFFMIEIAKKYRVHPFQYLLIGSALVLFYALLLSISEHLTFPLAYLIAAAATLFLLSFYTFFIIRKKGVLLLFSSLFTAFYAFLYVLLQSEDYALLLGSTGLFMLLGAVMYLTRNIDWYRINQNPAGK